MFQSSEAFSSFSVDDIDAAQKFYSETLGLNLTEKTSMSGGMFGITLTTGGSVMIYHKDSHVPATYTVLNFPVVDLDAAVDELIEKGVELERYNNVPQDEKGILRGGGKEGPSICWIKDPAGNIIAIMQAQDVEDVV